MQEKPYKYCTRNFMDIILLIFQQFYTTIIFYIFLSFVYQKSYSSVFFLSRESTCTSVSFPCVYGRLRAVFCIVFLKNSWQYIQYSSSLRILSVTLCDVILAWMALFVFYLTDGTHCSVLSHGWHTLCCSTAHSMLFYLTDGTLYVVLQDRTPCVVLYPI